MNPEFDSQNERRRLNVVRRFNILDTPPDGSFDRVTRLLARMLDVPIAVVSIVDEDRIWFKSSLGLSAPQIDRTPGLCASAMASDELYYVVDALLDPRTRDNPLITGDPGIRFYAAWPLKTQEGYGLGTVAVLDTKPRELTPSQQMLLEEMGGIVMDMLELQLSAMIQVQQQEMEQRNQRLQSLGVMAGGAAHDFSNLLTTVLAQAEVIAGGYVSGTEQVQESAQAIVAAAEDGAALCRRLKTYALGVTAQAEQVDLSHSVEQLQPLLEATVPDHITLKYDLPSDLPGIYVDPAAISQVVLNLCTNAADAIGGTEGEIRLRTCRRAMPGESEPGYVCLEVSDNGCGMDSETRSRIFDPFFSNGAGSEGLGMSVVHGIVRQCSGDVVLDSQPGQGSTICALFPAAEEPPFPTTRPEPVPPRVLVVDDEPLVLRSMQEMLESGGDLQTVGTGSGAEAIARVQQQADLDYAVIDVNMPELDGMSTFCQLREIDPLLRGILITGADARPIPDLDGIDTVLSKPIRMAALVDAVCQGISRPL